MHLDWLLNRFSQYSSSPAIIAGDRELSYFQLLDLVRRWSTRLAEDRTEPGDIVAIEADLSEHSVALLLALIDRGCIAMPLGPGAANSREEFLRIAEVGVAYSFMETPVRHVRYERPATNPLLLDLRRRKHPGLILFSSGSTGEHKGALHDLIPMLKKYETVRRAFRTLCLMQFDHIGGFNTLLHTLSNGGCVVPAKLRSPQSVCSLIERHKVELLPTTPTFLHLLLLSGCDSEYDLSSLKLITYGTEVMRKSTLERVRERFPQVQLLQTYGLTEVGILRSKSREDGMLWLKVGGEGYETKIVDHTLWIRATSAMLGYLNAPSPFDEDGWMNTHDKVEVEGEWIHVLGRTTDIINVGGEKVYPAEIENILLNIPNIKDATVYGKQNALLGNVVAARVQLDRPEDLSSLKQRIWAHCRDRVPRYKVPVYLEVVDELSISSRQKKLRSLNNVPEPAEPQRMQESRPVAEIRASTPILFT